VETTLVSLAKGLGGGEDGEPGVLILNPGTDREVGLSDRVSASGPLEVGDLLSARSGGGGGFGRPGDPAA
jgi:N-methylhydantoinase B